MVTDDTGEYLIVSSARAAIYTTDGATWNKLDCFLEWHSPTGYVDPDDVWDNEYHAYDDDTTTSATSYVSGTAPVWSSFLELTIAEQNIDRVRYYVGNTYFDQIDIDLYYNAQWNDLYEGTFTADQWVNISTGLRTVTAARIRMRRSDAASQIA